MLAPELEQILQQLYREARNAHYEFISLEHLLLVLIEEDASVHNVLKLCGTDLKVVSEQLAASVAENTPLIPDHLLDTVETRPTLGFQRVMQRAMVHTQSAGKAAVEPLDVLVALMSETDSHAVYFWVCNRLRVLKFCAASPTVRPMKMKTMATLLQTASPAMAKAAPHRAKTLYRRTPSTSTPKSKPAVSIP